MANKNKFESLTGLKGVFCLIITFFHTLPATSLIEKIPFTSFIDLYGGAVGNYMFFMLSGFLISYGYRERIQNGLNFGDFLLRRLSKMYPAYILSNLATVLIELPKNGASVINLKSIVLTILLQAGGGLESYGPYNTVGWFVSALFPCYMIYYAITHFSKTSTQYRLGLAASIAAGYAFFHKDLGIPFCHGNNGQAMMNFFVGCVFAEVYPFISQRAHQWLRPGAVIVLAGSFYLMMRYGVEIICGSVAVAFAFILCPVILYIALESRIAAPILKCKVLTYLGKISMSVYFWHCNVYFLFLMIYDLIVPGAEMKEKEYVVYLIITLVWSALMQVWMDRINWFQRKKTAD